VRSTALGAVTAFTVLGGLRTGAYASGAAVAAHPSKTTPTRPTTTTTGPTTTTTTAPATTTTTAPATTTTTAPTTTAPGSLSPSTGPVGTTPAPDSGGHHGRG